MNAWPIIGAGAGGVAAAYFLAGTFDVDLFEARSRIGGHCDSRVIKHRGRRITVDLGAQFFHPDTHPIYVTLLEELGLYDPDHPDADATLEAPGSLCIFRTAGGAPIFSSSRPLSTPRACDRLCRVHSARARRRFCPTCRGRSPSTPGSAACPCGDRSRETSCIRGSRRRSGVRGPTRSERRRGRSCRRSRWRFRPTFSRAPPRTTRRSACRGTCSALLDRSPTAQVHLSTPTRALSRKRAGWFLQTPAGRRGPYRFVVLNAPPRAGRELLRPLPAFADITALLDEYRYFDSRLLVHTDAAYVHRDRRNWGAYNAGVDGLKCEGSAWLGALQEKSALGRDASTYSSRGPSAGASTRSTSSWSGGSSTR